MKEIAIMVDDAIAQKLENRSSEEGMSINSFLSKAVEQNVDKLIRSRKWMPLEQWTTISRQEYCYDCVHLQTGQNQHGYPIANLSVSRLDLMKSQFVPGACILYCRRHVLEPYDLNLEERQAFFEDLMLSARALANVFLPIKMNYQILGNMSPHLHAYLQPRFYGDVEPAWPIDPWKEKVFLSDSEYRERISSIQEALRNLRKEEEHLDPNHSNPGNP